MEKYLKSAIISLFAGMMMVGCKSAGVTHLSTDYFGVDIDKQGYIVGMWNTTRSDSRNFSPADKPSPLLSLYDEEARKYYYPIKADFGKEKGVCELHYSNGSVAKVKIDPTDKYIRMELSSVEPRNGIDDVQWATAQPLC